MNEAWLAVAAHRARRDARRRWSSSLLFRVGALARERDDAGARGGRAARAPRGVRAGVADARARHAQRPRQRRARSRARRPRRCGGRSASGWRSSRAARSNRSPTPNAAQREQLTAVRRARSTSCADGRAAARRLARRERAQARADARDRRREAAGDARDSGSASRSSWCPTGWSRCTGASARCRRSPTGVGDLKRVLTNVKTRGTWGEVQLGALLAELLTPEQYGKNVETRPGSNERVEFAVRLPGATTTARRAGCRSTPSFRSRTGSGCRTRSSAPTPRPSTRARKALAEFLEPQARTIRDKYVEPPHTTDFAILFVPTEGLYAEMLSRPGLRRHAAARVSRHAGRPDEPRGAAQQPADGLSHARDRAALDRGVARAGRGARPSSAKFGDMLAQDQGQARPGEPTRSTRPAARRRRSRASCATSRRCPSRGRPAARHARRCSTSDDARRPATPSSVDADVRCAPRWRQQRVLRTAALPGRAVARSVRGAAVSRVYTRRGARAAARSRRAVPRCEEHRRRARPRRHAAAARRSSRCRRACSC